MGSCGDISIWLRLAWYLVCCLVQGYPFLYLISAPVTFREANPFPFSQGWMGLSGKVGWTRSASVLANTASAWEQKGGLIWNRWMSVPPLTVSSPSPAQDKERYRGETWALGPDVS